MINKVEFVKSLFDDEVFLAPTKIKTKYPIYVIDSKNPRTYKSSYHSGVSTIEAGRNAPKVEQFSLELMKDSNYLEFLEADDHNIAVVVGDLSSGVCSLDLDDDKFMEEFIELNKFFRDTLTTKATRGIQLWFHLDGNCPSPFYLTDVSDASVHYGEFRSTPWRTHIYGTHPTGVDYKIINDARPKRISFEEISWPKYLGFSRFYLGGRNFPIEMLSYRKSYKDIFRLRKDLLIHNDYRNLAVSYMDEQMKELLRWDIYPKELDAALKQEQDGYLIFKRLFDLPIKPSFLWIEPYSNSAGYCDRIKLNCDSVQETQFTLQEKIDANWAFA